MIPVHCVSSLNEKWPELLICRPLVGDRIESESGIQLEIVRIVHKNQRDEKTKIITQILEIELD